MLAFPQPLHLETCSRWGSKTTLELGLGPTEVAMSKGELLRVPVIRVNACLHSSGSPFIVMLISMAGALEDRLDDYVPAVGRVKACAGPGYGV